MTNNPPQLLQVKPECIPHGLRKNARWVNWRAEDRGGRFSKVPCFPEPPFRGLSTAERSHWITFDEALDACRRAKFSLAGIGYAMAGAHGIIGIDLDYCVTDGVIEPWVQEIIDACASYTEFSPSGTGVRIFVFGALPAKDITNIAERIEIYGGGVRFLTVTGHRVPGTPDDLEQIDDDVLDGLVRRYAKAPSPEIVACPLPDLVDELVLPDLVDLHLPTKAREFLTDGTHSGDRSAVLNFTATALFSEGLTRDEVFTILVQNPHALETAMDHRRHDYDRALEYLWVEQCLKTEAKRPANSADFEALVIDVVATVVPEEPMFTPLDGAVEGGSGDSAAPAPVPAPTASKFRRFEPRAPRPYHLQPSLHWLVHEIVPKVGVGTIYGTTMAGKSFVALQMAMHVAMGMPWRGRRVTQVPTAYIAAEGAVGFERRVAAFIEHHGLDWAEVGKWFRLIPAAPNMLEKVEVLELAKELTTWGRVGLVVIDTLAQVTPGADENSAQDMGRLWDYCAQIARVLNGLVALVHHAGKDESMGARGWSGLKGNADFEIQVSDPGNCTRLIKATKVKDGESGLEFGFTLRSVILGADHYGDPVTTCVVVDAEVPLQATRGAGGAGRLTEKEKHKNAVHKAITDMGCNPRLDFEKVVEAAAQLLPVTGRMSADGNYKLRRGYARDALRAMVIEGEYVPEDVDHPERTICKSKNNE